MKTIALAIALLLASTAITLAGPVVGQTVVLKTQASPLRTCSALVTKVISGDTVNLVAVIDDTDDWPDPVFVPSTHPAWLYTSVAKGTGVGEWQEATLPDPVRSATLVNPASFSAPSRSLNTNFKPSATRPTLVTVSGTWAGTLSATGSVAGSLQMLSDTATTPTTLCDDQQPSFSATLLVGIVITQTMPWKVTCFVAANNNVRMSTSGSGTFTITSVAETGL